MSQENDAASEASDEELPTIDEIMSSPVTPKRNRNVLEPAAAGAELSEDIRGRSVTVEASNRILPLCSWLSTPQSHDISPSVPMNSDNPSVVTDQRSWFREERPTFGRAAQPVMGYPTRPSPVVEEHNPRIAKRSTDTRFSMKAPKRNIVKFRVKPRSLQRITQSKE